MYQKELVSIIIPFHNAEKYVKNCLKCLQNQIYKNYEAIFVDDGSDDRTIEIINDCGDSRVKLISLQKSGVSTARNVGIQNATGEYITFWDIDDSPHNDFISTFVEDICKYKIDTVISNYEDVFAGDQHIKISLPWKNQVIGNEEIDNVLIPRMIYPLKNENGIRGLVWRTFSRTEVLKSNKIFFDPNITMAEDLIFVIELYKKSNSIYIEEKSLYDYIRNSTSTMNSFREDEIERQLLFHKIFIEKLKELNIFDENKKRYEANRLNMYSVCISNCVRNGNVQVDALKRLEQLRKVLINDSIDVIHSKTPKKIKITCLLLNLRMYRLLILIYILKEKKRIAKYS